MEFDLDEKTIWLDKKEGVSINYRSLSIEDYQKVAKFVGKGFSGSGDEASKGLNIMSDPELLTLSKELIEKYCFELKGITLKVDGIKRNATIQDLFKHGVFAPYLLTITTSLMGNSEVTEEEIEEVKK